MAENRLQSDTDQEHISMTWCCSELMWRWHCLKTGQKYNKNPAVKCAGILKNGEIIGSVIYHRFRWPDIEIGIETTDPAWCNRRILKEIFEYPLSTLNCKRVTATTDPSIPEVCQFLKRLGFVEEGRLRDALPHGDLLILGIKRDECRWVK